MYNLKLRHWNEKPYTRTGDILIAVNPYQWYDDLYTSDKRTYYSNRLVWDDINEEDPRTSMEPHVYEVSALAYRGLRDSACTVNQSILVSGESGAGKTETVKICLNHIASVQRGRDAFLFEEEGLDPTVQRVVQSNPLLEAFGNAQTRRNDNSSRFGKYLLLQFQCDAVNPHESNFIPPKRCALVGSHCDVYLLETNRVVRHAAAERTFHIFYQLLSQDTGVKSQYWPRLANATAKDFKYIGTPELSVIEGMTDKERFNETLQALELVDISGRKLKTLMQALAVVLQLGQLGFNAKNGDADKSSVSTTADLEALAELMGVSAEDLTIALTERTFTTGNETHKVPLSTESAFDACDALAKEVYHKVFLWVTKHINAATSADTRNIDPYETAMGSIGMLDIFGFETFDVNRFEQLCINYANEKLQQKFTEDIFTNVQKEYEAEGIPLKDIWYDDNANVLQLIEGRTGLLALLNEECVRPKGNDFDYCQKLLAINKDSPALVVHKMDRMSFGIKHYAGTVMYSAELFVAHNVDTLPTDLQACAEKSTNGIVNMARLDLSTDNGDSSKGNQRRRQSNIAAPTVWTKYRQQLFTLMTNLRATESRYIRCIKPNTQKKPLVMEHLPVVEQLRCAGVVAGITITRSVFPNRLPNQLVLMRFSNLVDKLNMHHPPGRSLEERQAAECRALLSLALKDRETQDLNGNPVKAFAVGKSKTYFRAGALEWLEAHRVSGLDSVAIVIQRFARGWLVRHSNRESRRKRRQAALDAERKKQEQKEREERERREAEDRRRRRAIEFKEYEEEIRRLERAIAEADMNRKNRLQKAKQDKEDKLTNIADLKAQIENLESSKIKETAALKVRQQYQLNENMKLIAFLKKENKRVQKRQIKTEFEHNDASETSEKLNASMNFADKSLSDLNVSATKTEIRHKSLAEQFRDTQTLNKELRLDVDKSQDKYMEEARARLQLQKGINQIVSTVQKKCRNKGLVEDVIVTALSVENETKAIMAGLDVETTDPNLVFGDDSEVSIELE